MYLVTVDVKTLPLHAIPRGKVGVFRVSESSYNRYLGEATGVQASTVLGLVVVKTNFYYKRTWRRYFF